MRNLSSSFFFFILLVLWGCMPLATFAQTVADIDSTEVYHEDTTESADENLNDQPSKFFQKPKSNYERFPTARNTASPSPAQWDSLTSDKAFGYKNEREYFEKKEVPKPPHVPAWLRAIMSFFRFFSTTLGLVILFVILAVIVFFLVYWMVSGERGYFARKNKEIKSEIPSQELSEDDLIQNNWDEKMRIAMQNGDYRIAVRYGYLMMLQLLQRRDLIVYRQDKTNADYYRELANTKEQLRPQFRSLTRAYEWAWYGGKLSTKEEADAYFNTFNQLKSTIT